MGDSPKQYRVIAALAQFTFGSRLGSMLQYVYKGGIIEEGTVPAHEIEHNLSAGLIEELDSPFDPLPEHLGDGKPPAEPTDPDDPDGPGGVPAKSALKPEWVEYAVSQGMDPAAAEASSKDALVAQYGG